MTTGAGAHARQHPDAIDDPLTAVLRDGARRPLAQAVEDGRARVVRHGHGPKRVIQTGVGSVPVRRLKVRDRGAGAAGNPSAAERVAFSSSVLPRWARRTGSSDALRRVLQLRGVSTGDFGEARSALLGRDAPNPSPSVISRPKESWQDECERGPRRDLAARRCVCVWADGVRLQARMGEAGEPNAAECMPALIGAAPEGRKERVGFQTGVRESAQSWREPLVGLKARRLAAPEIARASAPWASGRPRTRCSPARVTRAAGSTRPPPSSTRSPARCSPA